MKIIGRVELMLDEDGSVNDAIYHNGCIVKLTAQEVTILRALQDACDGQDWDIKRLLNDPYHYKPDDRNMAEAFGLVRLFMETRFAVNSFKEMVNKLETTLNGLEKRD